MGKLQDLVAKAIKDVQPDINAGVADAVAKSVGTEAPKASGNISNVKANMTDAQSRVAELGFIAKSLRGGKLNSADLSDLNVRAKAVGVTADVAELLPDGFTGTLLRDIEAALNVAKLFPMRDIGKEGIAHDTIALYGITAYMTAEATTGTDSAEDYKTFVATTNKVMAVVRKSYEILNDSLIDIASEVRMGIVRAIAEAVEVAVINGDIAGTQDGTTYPVGSAARVCNGIRYYGLNKVTVDASGVDYTAADGGEAEFLKLVDAMQQAGGLYTDMAAGARGELVLIMDNATYGKIRQFRSRQTGTALAQLFGGTIDTVLDIPIVSTSYLPVVDATGVIDTTTPANNVKRAMYLVNKNTLRLSTTGSVISESDKDITNQTFVYTGSLRFGLSSVYDSTEAAINTVTADQKNVVAAIDLAL